MLIVKRNPGQKTAIVLEDGRVITITSLSTKGNQHSLGFSAPKEIKVYRQEVLNRIKTEQKSQEDQAA